MSPGRDLLAAELGVFGGGATEVDDRADPAQDLLDSGGHQLGLFVQLDGLVAVADEGEDAPGDRVAGGLVAGDDEQLPEHEQVVVGKPGGAGGVVGGQFGVDEGRPDVVGRLGPFGGGVLEAVAVHLVGGRPEVVLAPRRR